jgi:hypothetical protein
MNKEQEALQRAYEFIQREIDLISEKAHECLSRLSDAINSTDVKKFMEAKGDLVRAMHGNKLLEGSACPYCEFNGHCTNCTYKEAMGAGCNDRGSDWMEAQYAINQLMENIKDYGVNCPPLKSSPTRTIKLGNISIDGNIVTFQIVEQTFRGLEFNNGLSGFVSSDGVELHSLAEPEVGANGFCCCRGDSKSKDYAILETDINNFARIVNAIKEYNGEN